MFNKDLNYTYLLDFYGEILSDKRREALTLYYDEDYSLSEVSEIMQISRQGARELIKKAEADLLFFEEKLGLAARFKQTNDLLSDIRAETDRMENLPPSLKEQLKKLSELLSENT